MVLCLRFVLLLNTISFKEFFDLPRRRPSTGLRSLLSSSFYWLGVNFEHRHRIWLGLFLLFSENQRLDESQLRWVQSQREAITSLLRVDLTTTAAASSESPAAPTMEPNALTVVEHILSREVHWNQWKNDGCPSFIKEPEKSTLTGRLVVFLLLLLWLFHFYCATSGSREMMVAKIMLVGDV